MGLLLEEHLAFGFASIQVFTRTRGAEVANALRNLGHGVTQLEGRGRDGSVDLVLSVVRRRDLPAVNAVVGDLAPDSFLSVESPMAIRQGWMFPKRRK